MLFSKAAPRAQHSVATADGLHTLHVAEYGSERGEPVVYLHGGPGGGIPQDAARLFDPERFRVVLFDQRGCGRSSCAERLRGNTTDNLVADVETIRQALGIECWGVAGTSYGALLTVLYTMRHSSRVQWALVTGVFLGSVKEVAWLYGPHGAASFYPQQWAAFEAGALRAAAAGPAAGPADSVGASSASSAVESAAAGTDADERPFAVGAVGAAADAAADVDAACAANSDAARDGGESQSGAPPPPLVRAYAHLLSPPDLPPRCHSHPLDESAAVPERALNAAKAFTAWEDDLETLAPLPQSPAAADGEVFAGAQIAAHYFASNCFFPSGDGCAAELLASREALGAVPCAIVQGRHDVICPPRSALLLHESWPRSSLRIVEGAGHALFEKPMRAAAQAALAQLGRASGSGGASHGGGGAGGGSHRGGKRGRH